MKAGDTVRLTVSARARFPDIGNRTGTVVLIDGAIAVDFGIGWQPRLPASDLEEVSNG